MLWPNSLCKVGLKTFYWCIVGQAGLPADQVAKAFQQAISNFIAGNPSHLKRIDVVIFDKQHLKTFQSNIANPAAVTSSSVDPGTATTDFKQPQQTPSRSRIEALETKIDRSHRVMIYFTSNSKANNKRVTLYFSIRIIYEKISHNCISIMLMHANTSLLMKT